MPRPKGSKNKKVAVVTENLEAKIAAAEADVEKLTAEIKAKKAELKELLKEKAAADKAAAEKKAAEDKAAILAAVEASGKTVEEILDFLK